MQYISSLSWNVIGACSAVSKRMIKDTILGNKVNILVLQETKCCQWNAVSIAAMWGNDFCGWSAIPASGLSGGLLCVWDKSLYNLEEEVIGLNWLRCKLSDQVSHESFHVINVYSPQNISDKRVLWEQLKQVLLTLKDDKVCLVGDFNCIRDDSKRANCTYARTDTLEFNHFLDNSNLLDLALSDD